MALKTKKIEVPDIVYEKPSETKELRIYREQDPHNPRDIGMNMGTMVCSHKRYDLGDDSFNADRFNGWKDYKNHLKEHKDIYVILPIYLYDHSQLSVSTSSFTSRWDSGKVGFIYTTKNQLEEFGHDVDDLDKNKVKEWLKNEVETYDDYLKGEIYRFELIKDDEVIDRCGGFHDAESEHLFGHAGINNIDDWDKNRDKSHL